MSRLGLDGPARKVALASLLTALVFVTALGVTVWQYDRAADSDARAIVLQGEARAAGRAQVRFWEETSAIGDYALTQGDDELGERCDPVLERHLA